MTYRRIIWKCHTVSLAQAVQWIARRMFQLQTSALHNNSLSSGGVQNNRPDTVVSIIHISPYGA